MQNKIIAVVVAVVIAGGAFYAGDVYGKGSTPTPGAGQFAGRGFGAGGAGAGRAGGVTAGQIIAKDATSITVKLSDGSTKIALVSGSTQILKTSTATLNDLSIGDNVTVTGSANSDGSVTAQMVMTRPAGLNFGGRATTTQSQ